MIDFENNKHTLKSDKKGDVSSFLDQSSQFRPVSDPELYFQKARNRLSDRACHYLSLVLFCMNKTRDRWQARFD